MLVGTGSTITSPGAGGALASQSTCVNYNDRAGQRTFTFTPDTAGVTIRALCGGYGASMFVAEPVTLVASTAAPTLPPTRGPTPLGGTFAPTATVTASPTALPTALPTTLLPTSLPTSVSNDGNSDDDDDYSETTPSVTLSPLLVGHILLAIVGFALFVPWAVLLSLFNHNSTTPHKRLVCGLTYKTWLALHLGCAVTGCLLGVAAFATGLASASTYFNTAHPRLGLAAVALCLVQLVAGATRNWWKRVFSHVHLVLGLGMVVLGLAACLTGVDELADFTSGLPYRFDGHVGEVGFSGPLGVAVAVICSVQLAALAVGFAQRLAVMFVRQTSEKSEVMSMAQVNASKHLVVYQGMVVNVEHFAGRHPGGTRVFATDKDITSAFQKVGHSAHALETLHSLVIGKIPSSGSNFGPSGSNFGPSVHELEYSPGGGDNSQFLQGAHVKLTVRVAQKKALTHNVFEFTLEYAPATLALGLPTCQHVCVFATDDEGKEFSRKYTPTEHGPGWFKLVIKVSKAGRMGRALDAVRAGDEMRVAGPVGLEEYLGRGRFKVAKQCRFTHLVLLAGGTGITPFVQLARAILGSAESDPTIVHLLSCNSTLEDVFLRNELEDLQRRFPQRFHVWFTISQPPSSPWPYSVGRVSRELLQSRYAALPQATTLVSVCGPPAFLEAAAAQATACGFAHVIKQ